MVDSYHQIKDILFGLHVINFDFRLKLYEGKLIIYKRPVTTHLQKQNVQVWTGLLTS